MFRPTKLLDAVQVEWPLLSRLTLLGPTNTPPSWAVASAQRMAVRLQPGELAACRAQLPQQAKLLAALYWRWVVTMVLALLLALTVIASASTHPIDSTRLGILISVLTAILLPPLVICNGIARDYVAARSLVQVLNGVVQPSK
jgi:hypothetical protein